MAKYLLVASYTAEGAKGVMKDGGTKRRQAAEAAIKSAGGKLEAFYFAFGENDAYVIVEAPDNASVAGMSLTIGGSGAVHTKTVVLLTPEEIDQASKTVILQPAAGKELNLVTLLTQLQRTGFSASSCLVGTTVASAK